MEARGAPPIDTSAAKAEMAVISGKQTPTPVRATSPMPSRWPMYIRSTMLYNTLMICAIMEGTASRKSSRPMPALPRSLLDLLPSLL